MPCALIEVPIAGIVLQVSECRGHLEPWHLSAPTLKGFLEPKESGIGFSNPADPGKPGK